MIIKLESEYNLCFLEINKKFDKEKLKNILICSFCTLCSSDLEGITVKYKKENNYDCCISIGTTITQEIPQIDIADDYLGYGQSYSCEYIKQQVNVYFNQILYMIEQINK